MKKARSRQRRITDRTGVCIIGLGYVGLPLAPAFAKAGLEVLGIDIQQRRGSNWKHAKKSSS